MRSFVQILIKKRCSFHREQFFLYLTSHIFRETSFVFVSYSYHLDRLQSIVSMALVQAFQLVRYSILIICFPINSIIFNTRPPYVKSKTLIISIQITIINEELKEKLTHIEQQTLSHALIIHSHLPSTIKKSNSYKNTKTTTTIIYVSNELIVS